MILAGGADAVDLEFMSQPRVAMLLGHLRFERTQGLCMIDRRDHTAAAADQETEALARRVEQETRGAIPELELPRDFQFHQQDDGAIDGGVVELSCKPGPAADFVQRRGNGPVGEESQDLLAYAGQSNTGLLQLPERPLKFLR